MAVPLSTFTPLVQLTSLAFFITTMNVTQYVYLVIGQTSPWSNESSPPTPNNSDSYLRSVRAQFYYAKQVSATDCCLGVIRYNWTTGTIYTPYSFTDPTFQNEMFYVLTSANRVYKCIANNSGAQSTVEPSSTAATVFMTSDGYLWKFMYDLTPAIAGEFLTPTFLPVPTGGQESSLQIIQQQAAIDTGSCPIGGHGFSAVRELFTDQIMINGFLDASEMNTLPDSNGFSYRQASFVLNPQNLDGSYCTLPNYEITGSNVTFDPNSGDMIYSSNFVEIIRSPVQNEEFSIVISI